MTLRYIVTVSDLGPPHLFIKDVQRRSFRRLDVARRHEARMCRKAMKKSGTRLAVHNWGSAVHQSPFYDPIRLVTITTSSWRTH